MKTYTHTLEFLTNYNINKDYFDFFTDDIILKILHFFKELEDNKISYTPNKKNIFKAFSKPIKEQKICLIGKDPYFQENVATGLSFEVKSNTWNKGVNTSLKNMLKLIYKTYQGEIKDIKEIREEIKNKEFIILNPDDLFTYYSENGVLLINSSLTTEVGIAGAHHKFWGSIIGSLLEYINKQNENIVYLVWGNDAKLLLENIEKNSFMNETIFKNKIVHNHPAICGKLDNSNDFLNGKSFELTKHLIDWTGKPLLIEYQELIDKINYHNDLYYNQNINEISDKEYDFLVYRLKQLEEIYSFKSNITKKVGGNSSNLFEKVYHNQKMLSLDNTYSVEELLAFDKRIKKIINTNENLEYVVELKIDGLSISLIYEQGKLTRAVTRGDGKIGEDVTENIHMISTIPKVLNEKIDIEVRGEIVLPLKEFERLNTERQKNGEELFKNPRNVASGTIRQLNKEVVRERNLDCYLYYIINPEKYEIKTQKEAFNYLQKLGFKTTGILEEGNIDNFQNIVNKWDLKRHTLSYMTDGLVVKLNEFKWYDLLSETAKSPRWAIAYKFETEKAITKLLDVTFQVGKTGIITPVAELEPVQLSGSIVKRASLHNFLDMTRKGIKIGDDVLVEKAAEIIPQVIKPIIENRKGNEKIIQIPTTCPSCGFPLEKEENTIYVKCNNPNCFSKFSGKLEYFVSKNCMNIVNLGISNLELFIEKGYIKKIQDIYKLHTHREEILSLKGFETKKIDKILDSIENSKKASFDRVLTSLCIPNVSLGTVPLLTKKFKSIDNLFNATYEELIEIDGIGHETANNILDFFKDELNIELINDLKEIGLNFYLKEEVKSISNVLIEKINLYTLPLFTNDIDIEFKNKSFLVTGKLNEFKKDEIKEIVEFLGGVYAKSVTKDLDYLISASINSNKLNKAKEIGITILSEDDFVKKVKKVLIDGN